MPYLLPPIKEGYSTQGQKSNPPIKHITHTQEKVLISTVDDQGQAEAKSDRWGTTHFVCSHYVGI